MKGGHEPADNAKCAGYMTGSQLVGIFGTGRSGTTLLLRLVDGMPDTYVHPIEVNFLLTLNELAAHGRVRWRTGSIAVHPRLDRLDVPVTFERLIAVYEHQMKELVTSVLDQLTESDRIDKAWHEFIERRPYTGKEFPIVFLRAFAELTGIWPAKHLVFKTIETPFITDYERVFPRMKFIHIIRNPLDTWASMKRTAMVNVGRPTWHHGGDSLTTLLRGRWKPHAQFLSNIGDTSRHAVIRYEDLLFKPQETISRICAHLSLPEPADPTHATFLGGRFPRKMPANVSQPGIETPREVVVNLSSRHNYADVITSRERDFIIHDTLLLARQFGYFQDHYRVKPSTLLWRWIAPDRWDFMNNYSVRDWLLAIYCFFSRRLYVARSTVLK